MKNPLYFFALLLILALFASCRNRQPQKDIFSEIKLKGKYKNPRKIDVVTDSLVEVISKKEFDALQLNKKNYNLQPVEMGRGTFYYAIEERKNYYLLFIYADKSVYSSSIDIVTYNKKWKIIDNLEISGSGGDGGGFSHSKCVFLDKNTFEVLLQRDFCTSPEQNFENICEKSITKYKINPNGKIDSLSTKYLIKNDSCYQKGVEFMDRMSKK